MKYKMTKTPIAFILDDPTARVFVYYEHSKTHKTADGRPLVNEVPNDFLTRFIEVVKRWNIRGKFTVVPCPGGRGNLAEGITGFPKSEIDWWLDKVRTELSENFSFCPEMLTHAGAMDLQTGKLLEENEYEWAKHQTRETLTPYIELALRINKEAGIYCSGISSPWGFGSTVKEEYVRAISEAVYRVHNRTDTWYFGEFFAGKDGVRPYIAYEENGRRVVSVPSTVSDMIWQSMDTTDTSEEYVQSIADLYLTADGTSGEILRVLNNGGVPVMLTHWQSLFSNGAETGLRIFNEIGRRVQENLSDRVEWLRHDQIMHWVFENR